MSNADEVSNQDKCLRTLEKAVSKKANSQFTRGGLVIFILVRPEFLESCLNTAKRVFGCEMAFSVKNEKQGSLNGYSYYVDETLEDDFEIIGIPKILGLAYLDKPYYTGETILERSRLF